MNDHNIKVVYFAVATTGFLGQNAEICQIAAMEEKDETPWSVHILPDEPFVSFASSYNGYTTRVATDGEMHLLKDGVKVETSTLTEALVGFIQYVTSITADSASTTVLVGWCSQRFHTPLLLQAFKQCRLSFSILESAGVCYGDPYLMIKKMKDRFPLLSEVSSLSLPVVYQHLCQSDAFDSIPVDACRSIQMLQSVMSSLKVTKEHLKNCSFTLSSADEVQKFHRKVKHNLDSMEGKLFQRGRSSRGDITESMARKIAESGLKYRHLRRVYRKRGREGLERMLKAPLPSKEGDCKAKPRVTRCQRVIDAIVNHFEVHCRPHKPQLN